MERAFTALYDDAKELLAQGYRRADQRVYNFTMEFDISPEDAWQLIAQEASQRGEGVIRYLSENPLDERSYKLKNAQRQPEGLQARAWTMSRSGSEAAVVAVSRRRLCAPAFVTRGEVRETASDRVRRRIRRV